MPWRAAAALAACVTSSAIAPAQAAPIALGQFHTCAVSASGGLRCWGDNSQGQLGDGTTLTRLVPVAVQGLGPGVTDVAAGALHTCALEAGTVYCFGNNDQGQLASSPSAGSSTPSRPSLPSGLFVGITAGNYHTCVLSAGGGVLCWGNNADGEIGNGTLSGSSFPVTPQGLDQGVLEVSAGGNSTCALMSDRTVRCWGNSGGGYADLETPSPVPGVHDVTQLATGANGACAVTLQGTVLCWDFAGSLAPGVTQVQGLDARGVAVTVGGGASCVLEDSTGVRCWGSNALGQLGDGTGVSHADAGPVLGLSSGVRAVASGSLHSCALLLTGSVECWGYNGSGQLGTGDRVGRDTPAQALLDYLLAPKRAVEYYHARLDHYFITLIDAEITALDQGRFEGWARTGDGFNAWPLAADGTSPVCRFYLPPAAGDSHFYSASPAECNVVRLRFPAFVLESPEAMHLALPDAATGSCPASTIPVYRLWNKRTDTNHRYTASPQVRLQMIARGYVSEGYGPAGVAMCAPQ